MQPSPAPRSFATVPLSACLAMAAFLAFPSPARASLQPAVGIFSDVHVAKGEVRHDDVVCIGGTATVEGKVEGDVVVIRGKLILSGEASDVVTVLSDTRVDSSAVIHGDFVHVLGHMEQDPSATVQGQVVDLGSRLPSHVQRILSRGFLGILLFLRIVSLIVSLVLILLLALLAPERIDRMSIAVEPRWPASLGFGLLGYVVAVVLTVLFVITLIGIPLAILLWLVVKILGLLGVAAILAVIGRKVGAGTGLTSPAPSILAAVFVGFLVIAVVRFIPVLGGLVWLVLSVLGLGLTLVTKVGSSPAAGIVPGAPAVAGGAS